MAQPDGPGSLASIPITPYGGRMEVSGKHGDITLELLLGKENIATVDIDPEVASTTSGLLDYLGDDASRADSFFARCARRIRDFVNRKNAPGRAPPRG